MASGVSPFEHRPLGGAWHHPLLCPFPCPCGGGEKNAQPSRLLRQASGPMPQSQRGSCSDTNTTIKNESTALTRATGELGIRTQIHPKGQGLQALPPLIIRARPALADSRIPAGHIQCTASGSRRHRWDPCVPAGRRRPKRQHPPQTFLLRWPPDGRERHL